MLMGKQNFFKNLILTSEQKAFWFDNGYLILPGFFSENLNLIEAVVNLHEKLWQECPDYVVVDDLETHRRCFMTSLSEAEKKHKFKVNDLYLNYKEVRDLSLNERLVDTLSELLPECPVLCNTLSLDYGTQQFFHVDSLYMTPVTDYHLVATWIALEDCHPDAGPLRYFPGSHKIPIYRFSTGSPHVVDAEFGQWQKYIHQKIDEYGLKEETFLPKKGDVFIWHAQLLHGGSPIKNPQITRKSLVSHYFTKSDCLHIGSKLKPTEGGYWMDRPPQMVFENNNKSNRKLRKSLMKKVEHILRTTLHYFRLWKRDIINILQDTSQD
jgi:hypothetical protein